MTPWIGPNGQPMRRLELHLTYTCPERCVFCSEDHRMQLFNQFPVTWGRIAKILRMHAERGVRNVHFTGGEPTIHPRFIDALRLAKKLGMRTSIGTIGTRLSKRDFAEKSLPFLDEALFSIHGPNADIHDALAQRKGSFERVTAALQNALDINSEFGAFVNTVLVSDNIDCLPETIAFLEEMGAKMIVVSNLTPEGAGHDAYAKLTPKLERLMELVPRTVAAAKSAVLRFFGVPLCVLKEHWTLSNDLHWDPRVTVEWAASPGKVSFDGIYSWKPDRKRKHVEACASCLRNSVCMGVFEEYVDQNGSSVLETVRA